MPPDWSRQSAEKILPSPLAGSCTHRMSRKRRKMTSLVSPKDARAKEAPKGLDSPVVGTNGEIKQGRERSCMDGSEDITTSNSLVYKWIG